MSSDAMENNVTSEQERLSWTRVGNEELRRGQIPCATMRRTIKQTDLILGSRSDFGVPDLLRAR